MTDQASELDTLLPEQTVRLAGVNVTLREYTFMQGLRVDNIAGPVVDGLSALFLDRDSADGFELSELAAVFGAHPQIMSQLLSISCEMPVNWVENLSDADGQQLLLTWWAVNRFFFTRRLVQEMAARQAAKKAADRLAGPKSSPA